MQNRKVVETKDGSKTIYIPEMEEHYHSSHGALQEAIHVFIVNGLLQIDSNEISIFEMGFGTGLNAALTYVYKEEREITYHGIEAYPVDESMAKEMNYPQIIEGLNEETFNKMHEVIWDEEIEIADGFKLKKIHSKIEEYQLQPEFYDVIYFDAFGYRAQSKMWDLEILQNMYNGLKPGGMLVTYAARGQFKRDLKSLGFEVKSVPGPPGKREMTIALKSV